MFMELRKLYRVHNFSYEVTYPIYVLNKIRINEIIGTVKEIEIFFFAFWRNTHSLTFQRGRYQTELSSAHAY